MLCERCQENQATVIITKISNGQKTEARLCENCAQQENNLSIHISPKVVLQNFFADFFNSQYPGLKSSLVRENGDRCEACGFTDAHFPKLGKMGCSDCYKTFSTKIDPLLRKIHGTVKHTGKIPQRAGGGIKLRQEIVALRENLQQAIAKEEYELAARLRDDIREKEIKLREGKQDDH